LTDKNKNNIDELSMTILKEISEKTSSIQTSIGYHNERLTKIEEAILQLAATNERVRSMDSVIREIKGRQEIFETEVWTTFEKVREEGAKCNEHRTATDQHFMSHDRRIEKIEEWKDQVSLEVQSNTRVRSWIEKGVYAIIIFLIIGVIGSFFVFNGPDPIMIKLNKIEAFIEQTHPEEGDEFSQE